MVAVSRCQGLGAIKGVRAEFECPTGAVQQIPGQIPQMRCSIAVISVPQAGPPPGKEQIGSIQRNILHFQAFLSSDKITLLSTF